MFTKIQIETLRAAWDSLERLDPTSEAGKNLRRFLDGLSQKQLKVIADAKIKFVSRLALNRVQHPDWY